MERRVFLRSLGVLGCSLAAHPLTTTLTLAEGTPALGENRLVVIILRGAMDGLDVLQPRGDAGFAAARPTLVSPGTDLDGFFALNDSLSGLLPLWQAGEIGFVHATSTPYRDKRSHFDGQDMLEAGTGTDIDVGKQRDGWLNRLLQTLPGIGSETAWAVGREAMPILAGKARTRSWAPDQALRISPAAETLLQHVYHDDPLFREAGALAFELSADGPEPRDADVIVNFAAERLRDTARIAAFSLNGWDTHKGQIGGLRRPLGQLQHAILKLRDELGPETWGKTVVLAMTEFGRTVRENGTKGTDHGTGGAMLFAGGSVKGGKVLGRWPGLAEADLYDRRDLLPTSDVRDWAAEVLQGLYGLDRTLLETAVFPGLRMDGTGGLIL
jgi:uncharacterized protein (DUF1501 family)